MKKQRVVAGWAVQSSRRLKRSRATLKHKGQNGADDDDQTDNIDDRVHDISPGLRVLGERHAPAAVPYVRTQSAARLQLRENPGGAERNRTADLLIANEALYQLSYGPQEGAELGVRWISVKPLKGSAACAALSGGRPRG